MPLETLTEKDFNKKLLSIQAPFEADEKRDRDGASTNAGESEELETNAKKLYQKFNNLMSLGQIEVANSKTSDKNGTNMA